MHVRFGQTEKREFPARDGKPASVGYVQKGWIIEPGQNGEPDTSKPFTVTHRSEGDSYIIGELYGLSAAHLVPNRYDRLEFNPFAPFRLLDAPASKEKPLSATATAQAPRAA